MVFMNDTNMSAPAPLLWSSRGHVITHHPAAPVARTATGAVTAAFGQGVMLDLDVAARGLTCGPEALGSRGDSGSTDLLLGLDLGAACPPGDVWLRGPDVTAVYEPADARRLRATAMWRLHHVAPGSGPWFACEVVASVQTAVLESDSAIAIISDVADGPMLWGCPRADGDLHWVDARTHATPPPAATCLLVRRSESSVAVAVHPGDVRRIDVHQCSGQAHDARRRVSCWLFTGTTEKAIEKGVLLRGRVFAACGPVVDDAAWAAAAIRSFNASPPPLTT
jgi:hypothetical protein